jgi:hypothetical protein
LIAACFRQTVGMAHATSLFDAAFQIAASADSAQECNCITGKRIDATAAQTAKLGGPAKGWGPFSSALLYSWA